MSAENRQFRGGTSHLSKATSCIPCRRGKLKCDRARPACEQCITHDRSEDCQYEETNVPTQTEILEEQITRLEARIRQLKKTPNSQASITLSDPYASRQISILPQSPEHDELIPPTLEQLLNSFLPYSSELGFFLNAARFKSAMLLALPIGHPSRPAPPLIYAVSLCGIYISRQANSDILEERYRRLAVEATYSNLSGSHPLEMIHGIQAEVLLAYYFIANSRYPEARYHITAAVSMSIYAGLHKIGPATTTVLLPPQDSVEAGERIIGMWSVLILDRSFANSLGEAPQMIFPSDDPSSQFVTPWPLDMGEYAQGHFRPNVTAKSTILDFLNGQTPPNSDKSPLAMHAKAVLLWEKVAEMVRNSDRGMEPSNSSAFFTAFAILDAQIQHLQASLPPLAFIPSIRKPEHVRKLVSATMI